MKEELETKYVPPSFSVRLMDNWHQYTQGNKSVKEYVKKFDEFLFRCSTLHKEGKAQILSKFKIGLRVDLRTELLARVNELEVAYALIQNLDSARTNHTFKSHDYRASVSSPSPSPQPNRSKSLHIGMASRVRVLNGTTETRIPSPPKLVPQPSATNPMLRILSFQLP